MKKEVKIYPTGLKGNQINERMKELMGITPINEDRKNFVVELTKIGPDGNAYAIVRENHEYYIKTAVKKENLVAEDFKYIGGLQNKKSEAYPSYAKATKHLNLKFNSLAESFDAGHNINVLEDDNLLNEAGAAAFSNMNGMGFSGIGNLEGNTPMFTEEVAEENEMCETDDDIELSEAEQAIQNMLEDDSEEDAQVRADVEAGVEDVDALTESVKKKSLNNNLSEEKYVLKVGATTAPATPEPAPTTDAGFGADTSEPSAEPAPDASSEKPFDDEPFDAGVEADENSDPKKYIEQLTGKLGQSLRTYNESMGQPDLELEKFAINSLLSACHTSQMDQEDKDDIIKKVNEGGSQDNEPADNGGESNGEESDVADAKDDLGDTMTSDPSGVDQGDEINEEESIFLKEPKKNNMFQPNSNDILDGDLNDSEKSRIFAIKNKLQETFNQEDEKMAEPMTTPEVKPAPVKTPSISPAAPSRKNKPFLPMPSVQPDPKAATDNEVGEA